MTSPSPSPPSLSPTTPHPGAHLLQHSQQPQSKRDKRRNALSDRLSQLTKSFHNPTNPRTRDQHYRSQITALQVDMQLVIGADVSGRDMRLLDDSAEAVQRSTETVLQNLGLRSTDVGTEGTSGRWYAEFIQKVNNEMEERDAQLTLLNNAHRIKAASLVAQHMRSVVHAREEHKLLADSIKVRLSARLKSQLRKLAQEKDTSTATAALTLGGGMTDISDANALQLHPSHYGLNASIGSPRRNAGHADDDNEKETGRRKPRRRAGEVEELMAFGAGMNFDSPNGNGKRKRRGAAVDVAQEDEAGGFLLAEKASPSVGLLLGGDCPESDEEYRKQHRDDLMKQYYRPTYSLEKLFTAKEVEYASHQAALATVRHFSERLNKDPDPENNGEDNDDTPTGANTPVPNNTLTVGEDDMDVDQDDRTRGISPYHDVRPLPALPGGLNGVTTRSNPLRQIATQREMDSIAYLSLGQSYVNKTGIAPTPPGLRPEDMDADIQALRKDKRNASGNGESSNKRQKRS
ncbi:Sds3-like-domain-containing protein [Pyronema domesticum]|nr:Sds3-like-domain-containing protein [Pyronema domesticum]